MGTESPFAVTRNMVLAIAAAALLALAVSFLTLGLELASNAENHHVVVQPHHISHSYNGPIGGSLRSNTDNPYRSNAS